MALQDNSFVLSCKVVTVCYCDGTDLNDFGNNGNYWESTLNNIENGCNCNFNNSNFNPDNNNNRYYGYSVRPVQHSWKNNAFKMKLTKEQLILDLQAAFQCAKKHKSNKSYVQKFEENLDSNIEILAEEFL